MKTLEAAAQSCEFPHADTLGIRGFIDLIPDAVLILNENRVVFANGAAVKLFKAKNEASLVGLRSEKFVEPEYALQVRQIKSGDNPLITARLNCLDGDTIEAEIRTSCSMPYQFAVIRDVSHRNRLHRKLAANEEKFRMLFEQSPIGLSIIGKDTFFLKVNQAFCGLLGYSEEELLCLAFPNIIHPDDQDKDMHLFAQLLREEIPSFELEKRYVRKDKTIVWVGLTVALIRSHSGAPLCCIVFSEDILDEKLAEEQRKAHARVQRNTLIREVNHRIKNNIQSVIGLLRYQMRQNPELGKWMQQAIDRLHAVAIVHGMHGISRLGSCSLVKMVSQICDSAEATSNGRQTIKLQVLVPNDVIVAEGESVPTALIVNELIANAVKHGNIRKSPIRVTLNGDKNATIIRIENAASGRDVFRIESGNGLGTGLNLVEALLPPTGASLAFKSGHGEVTAELRLIPPVIG